MKLFVLVIFLHLAVIYGMGNEFYIDSTYSGLKSDGTQENPLNNIDIVQKYMDKGIFQQFIVKNSFFIDKPLMIENMTINLRQVLFYNFKRIIFLFYFKVLLLLMNFLMSISMKTACLT